MGTTEPAETVYPAKWIHHLGLWTMEGVEGLVDAGVYTGPTPTPAGEDPVHIGLAISDITLRSGSVRCEVVLPNPSSAGRIVFGYDADTSAYYSVGVGGGRFAYYLDRFEQGRGWSAVAASGASQNLETDRTYSMQVHVRGQRAYFWVDEIQVFESQLPVPLPGNQVGLIAWGEAPIRFAEFVAFPEPPRAFVVMQFAEPYDSLYKDVIKPVCERAGLQAYRADEILQPGVILSDIIEALTESQVIVAEVTPINANVFYELGYAHALQKDTILLAQRGNPPPFDISGYRTIRYEDTIAGKANVESMLEKHLAGIGFPPI